MEPGEEPVETAIRELAEEVGIHVSSLTPIAPLYIRRADINFVFHMFFLPLQEMPILAVAPEEHTEAAWVNFQEAVRLPLLSGSVEAIEYFLLWKNAHKVF
jgi:8-oxo-dGTP pyrophosphatase MutT (NUDIX family)